MITWTKELVMRIQCKDRKKLSDKRTKSSELTLRCSNYTETNDLSLIISLPSDRTISELAVSPEWLMEACKKAISLKEI